MISTIRGYYGLEDSKVLSVLEKVPREKFVSRKYYPHAYDDVAIPIGHDQTISQPYTVAFMTHLLGLKGKEKVLEIGTGSGYQAAVLSLLASQVYSIEIVDELATKAKERLKKLGYSNIHVKSGTGEKGWDSKSPFDAIIITAGLRKVPEALFNQLQEGGVLVAPIGERDHQVMTRFTKNKLGKISKEEFSAYVFVPFITSE